MDTNTRFQDHQHVNESSSLTIKTICKELKPGESLYIHKDGSQGINNEDFIAVFTKFSANGKLSGNKQMQ